MTGARGRPRKVAPNPAELGHAWVREEPRRPSDPVVERCTRCHGLSHWALARALCVPYRLSDRGHGVRVSKKHTRRIATVIPGRVPNRDCGVCAAPYFSQHGNSRYCSQPCAAIAWGVQHARSQAKSALRQETPAQRLLRTERQRARRATERATDAAE